MTSLHFDDATVRGIGKVFMSKSRTLGASTQVHLACDLGDNELNGLLDQVRSAINDGGLGAQTEVYALGQAAIDSADAYTDADQF